jgi:hypothetical protein
MGTNTANSNSAEMESLHKISLIIIKDAFIISSKSGLGIY